MSELLPLRIHGPALVGFDHVFVDATEPVADDDDGAMMGLDYLGVDVELGAVALAPTPWDEVAAPVQVTLSPHIGGSTVFGNRLTGKPSGVARVAVTGGAYWRPDPTYQKDANNWDDSKGSAPRATVYFVDGSRKSYLNLQAVNVLGGALRRGVGQSWFARLFRGAP